MNYFPVGKKDKVNVMIDGKEIDLNKIEFLFSNYYNAKLDDLPFEFYYGSAVVINNVIHILGGNSYPKRHYSLYGDRWISQGELPYSFSNGVAVVVNGEIHILGGGGGASNHYKWDGSTWTQVSTLPYALSGRHCVVVCNNEIHILGGNYNSHNRDHYKWDGSTWTQVSTLPYAFYEGMAVVHKGCIHIMGGNDGSNKGLTYHYRWNGNTWGMTGSLPIGAMEGIVTDMDDEIYFFAPSSNQSQEFDSIYKFIDVSGTFGKKLRVTLPRSIRHSSSIIPFRGELHLLGNAGTGWEKEHYKLAVKNYSMVVHK